MTSADFYRLAEAVRIFEDLRGRVHRLNAIAARLASFDVIVVAGEQAVLERLMHALDYCHGLLTDMHPDGDGMAALDRLEAQVQLPGWSVLEEVQRQLGEKEKIVAEARSDVESGLAKWKEIARRVEAANQQIQFRRLRVAEPRRLEEGRSRMSALVRQANASFEENRLLDVWRALGKLESAPVTHGSAQAPVPPKEVPEQLEALIDQAASGSFQLTVLRGPTDASHIEYTVMLLAPTGDGHVGINVQDTSTIVTNGRDRLLRDTGRVAESSYRVLRDAALVVSASPAEDHTTRLRELGKILYQLMIPTRMLDLIEQKPTAPLVVISNDRHLCWEAMFGDTFVALQRPLARMPVGRLGARRARPIEPPAPRPRVALVASAGTDRRLPAAIHEVELIAEKLTATWGDTVEIDVFVTGTQQPANGDNFDRILIRNYNIIHYAGHANFNARRPGQSGLVLDGGEPCSVEKIQRLISGTPLVFLNACETARLSADETQSLSEGTYAGDPTEGLASAFLYGGALACIGNSWPVVDTVAADFAVTFYSAALEGLSLGEAMRLARKDIAERPEPNPNWASFVLYGDPGFSLRAFDRVAPRRRHESNHLIVSS
jgi:hypothetical protein